MNKKYYVVTASRIIYTDCPDPEIHLLAYDCEYADVYENNKERRLVASAKYYDFGNGRFMVMKGYVQDERDC